MNENDDTTAVNDNDVDQDDRSGSNQKKRPATITEETSSSGSQRSPTALLVLESSVAAVVATAAAAASHQPPSKKTKKKHVDPEVLQFRMKIQLCCKQNDLSAAIPAYHEAVSKSIRIEAQTFYNLLHLCSNDTIGNDASSSSSSNNNNMDGDHGLPTTTMNTTTSNQKTMKIHVGTPRTTPNTNTSTNTTSYTPLDATDLCSTTTTTTTTTLTLLPPTTTTAVTMPERRQFAERVQSHMDQLQIPLIENAYTALVRLYCSCCNSSSNSSSNSTGDKQNNDSNDAMLQIAERLLTQAEQQPQCKVRLRLYTPLLQTYCTLGLLHQALQVWYRAAQQALTLTEVEYAALLQCCCSRGGTNDAGGGYPHHHNTTTTTATTVVERVLSDLAEDVLIPSHATRRTLIQWFQSPHAIGPSDDNDNNKNRSQETTQQDKDIINLLSQIKVPNNEPSDTGTTTATMGPVQSRTGWIISESCRMDTTTGTLLSGCLQHAQLQPMTISPTTWARMKQMNENIAITNKVNDTDTTNYQGGGKGRKTVVDDRAIEQRRNHWNRFQTFLSYKSGTEILIDGANVGYYEQNFNGAPKHVDYHQIDWMVQHFVHQKRKVLLIMHSRHFAANWMPPYAQPIVQKWIKHRILYQTPPGMNDDWFWLHAALHFGPGTCIVTNDEMRDHHFQMIAPRAFIRWRDRHQIHFDFGHWVTPPEPYQRTASNEGKKVRAVILKYPDPYSRRIQRVLDGLVIPLPKRGDTNRFLDGVFVANDEERNEETYLCIRPMDK